MLRILRPCHSLRTAHDTLSGATERWLRKSGVACCVEDLWPERWAGRMRRSRLPFRRRLFRWGPARQAVAAHLRRIEPGDVVWVSGPAIPDGVEPTFCRRLRERGASYVFHMLDDWFSVPYLRPIAEARIPLAELVVVPTAGIRDQISRHYPSARVEVLEEPVDIERLRPSEESSDPSLPRLVWCGGVNNQKDLAMLGWIVEKLKTHAPFRLRVIAGRRRPELSLPVPWEWRPYDYAREREDLAGAVAGLAPLQKSPYADCKGTYKVKTYMACGVPPVASPVGHALRLIRHGENGFLPASKEDWVDVLLKLVREAAFARKMSAQARRDAVEKYSHKALMPVWAERLKHHFPQLKIEN